MNRLRDEAASRCLPRSRRRLGVWLALCATLLALFGCQSLVGIEEHSYLPGEPVDPGAPTPECEEYCADVMANCSGEYAQYSVIDTCLGTCALLDPGDRLEPSGNNLACRANQARLALSTQEPNVHCPRAGPFGGNECGAPCESYCALREGACDNEFPSMATCVEKCGALDAETPLDPSNLQGDTLSCRMVHVNAASVDPDAHCAHTGVLPADYCVGPPDDAPTCEGYCRLVTTACTDGTAVYESEDQCLAVCAALSPGTNADTSENTVGCRNYHAHASLLDPATHCPHAGPGGDANCGFDTEEGGGNCSSYCRLLEAACEDEFQSAHEDQGACIADCGTLSDAQGSHFYTVSNAESNGPLACRLLNVTRAFADADACAAAIGADACAE